MLAFSPRNLADTNHRRIAASGEPGGEIGRFQQVSGFRSEALECGSESERASAFGEAKTTATKETRNPELGTRNPHPRNLETSKRRSGETRNETPENPESYRLERT
ncbi:MAG: hypothetical protein Kow00109_22350 [Acidobacteriota bacterium]